MLNIQKVFYFLLESLNLGIIKTVMFLHFITFNQIIQI